MGGPGTGLPAANANPAWAACGATGDRKFAASIQEPTAESEAVTAKSAGATAEHAHWPHGGAHWSANGIDIAYAASCP